MVGVMVNPGLPTLKLSVRNQQPLLTKMEDTTTRVVSDPPQLPGSDQAAPAQANQSAAAFVHLVQEGQDVKLALHW